MRIDPCRHSGSTLLCTSTLKENLKIKLILEKLRDTSEAVQNMHFFHTFDEVIKMSNKLAPPICHHLSPIFQPSPPKKSGDVIYGWPSYQSWSKAAKQAGRREKKKLTLLLRSHKSWLPNRQTKLSRLLNTVQSLFFIRSRLNPRVE